MAWAMFWIINLIIGSCYFIYSRILEGGRAEIVAKAFFIATWVAIMVLYVKTFLL